MKSDDEKLRELFGVKEKVKVKSPFNNTIRRVKALSLMRNIIVSLMIFVIVSFMLLMVNARLLNSMSQKEEANLRNLFNVAMPNAYMSGTQVDDRLFVGQIDYERYRFIGNKPVFDGSFKEGYTYMPLINGIYGDAGNYLFSSSASSEKELQEMAKYNKSGKRIMKFYRPSVKYVSYINELANLDQIDGNKLAELSLSFDKSYTIDEVKNIIPKNITLNWYWVDTFDERDNGWLTGRIFDESEVYGIKALDRQGRPIDNPEQEFINAVMNGREIKNSSGLYNSIYDTLNNGKGQISKDKLRIIGVVVSGKVEDLKTLSEKQFIKAVTIGAVADRY